MLKSTVNNIFSTLGLTKKKNNNQLYTEYFKLYGTTIIYTVK